MSANLDVTGLFVTRHDDISLSDFTSFVRQRIGLGAICRHNVTTMLISTGKVVLVTYDGAVQNVQGRANCKSLAFSIIQCLLW